MISAYLKQQQISVHQADLNIWITMQSLSNQFFLQKARAYQEEMGEENKNDIKQRYKNTLFSFFQTYSDELHRVSFLKEKSTVFNPTTAIRLSNNAIELALEGSILKQIIPSLEEIIRKLNKENCSSKELDLPAKMLKNHLIKLLSQHNPKVVGISVSYFSQLLPSLLLAQWIKSHNQNIKVVLGGQQIMLRHKELASLLANNGNVNGLCTGAGEESLEKYIYYLNDLVLQNDVPSFIFLDTKHPSLEVKKSSLHINDLPTPDFTGLPIHSYMNTEVQLPLITCFGCYWGRCVFCSYGNRSFLNNSYQQITSEKIADHCESLIQKYGVTRINFVDENNNLPLILKGVRILNSRGYQITFSTRNRLERILKNVDFCQELADRGCVLMSVGYETNVQRLLDKMDKGVKAANYQTIIDNLHYTGITLRFSIMGGILDETEEEFNQSLLFLKKNVTKIGIDVMQMLVMEPETRLSHFPETFGLHNIRSDILRGNQKLSYLHGRMGYAFDYPDKKSFEEKLERFIEIFKQVKPVKNTFSHTQTLQKKIQNKYYNRLNLHPWVVCLPDVIESESESILVDLQHETFYRLPKALAFDPSEQCLISTNLDNEVDKLMNLLEQRGLGTPVIDIKVPLQ